MTFPWKENSSSVTACEQKISVESLWRETDIESKPRQSLLQTRGGKKSYLHPPTPPKSSFSAPLPSPTPLVITYLLNIEVKWRRVLC